MKTVVTPNSAVIPTILKRNTIKTKKNHKINKIQAEKWMFDPHRGSLKCVGVCVCVCVNVHFTLVHREGSVLESVRATAWRTR